MRLPSLPPVPVSSRTLLGGILLLTMAIATACSAEEPQKRWDLSLTANAYRSLRVNSGQNFWMEGGSVDLGVNLRRGWGLSADLTGAHTGSVGSGGVPLSVVVGTVGPRYRWTGKHKVSLYGQGLVGTAHGFDSIFPTQPQTRSSANSLALQLGGGMDYRLTRRVGLRPIDAGWLRTYLPNGANNTQNTLRLGAGATFHF